MLERRRMRPMNCKWQKKNYRPLRKRGDLTSRNLKLICWHARRRHRERELRKLQVFVVPQDSRVKKSDVATMQSEVRRSLLTPLNAKLINSDVRSKKNNERANWQSEILEPQTISYARSASRLRNYVMNCNRFEV